MQHFHGVKAVVLHGFNDVFGEAADLGRGAECAVVHVAAGPASDLTDFRSAQSPRLPPVELAGLGKGDVVKVHVQTHANGIGRNQIIDLARLIHVHLGVTGPWA